MTSRLDPVITIDGASGTGKGTISQLLATRLGWHFLDSGALYRVLALAAQKHAILYHEEQHLQRLGEQLDVQFIAQPGQHPRIVLEGEDVTEIIRTEEIGSGASLVGALPGVRAALLARQRAFRSAPGLVADGRDMGTVVFPDAVHKYFLIASPEERARRRHQQLIARGFDVNLGSLLEELKARDQRDQSRAIAPLKPADDAVVVDTDQRSIEAVLAVILEDIHS
jgi:cytidylate kinase